jgi:hypothetical protein
MTILRLNGEAGIRTRGTGLTPYNGLANRRFKPLSHLSSRVSRTKPVARNPRTRRRQTALPPADNKGSAGGRAGGSPFLSERCDKRNGAANGNGQ